MLESEATWRFQVLESPRLQVRGIDAIVEGVEGAAMCRNIKTLANFEPPATPDEIRASALQFVRKLSGTTRPSRANEEAFNRAVDDVTAAARQLIASLTTTASPRNRDVEAARARERSRKRYGTGAGESASR